MTEALSTEAMHKHSDCANACQQAVQYGVWPMYSCSPSCVMLQTAADDYQREAIAEANAMRADDEPADDLG